MRFSKSKLQLLLTAAGAIVGLFAIVRGQGRHDNGIVAAIQHGDVEAVRGALRSGTNPNTILATMPTPERWRIALQAYSNKASDKPEDLTRRTCVPCLLVAIVNRRSAHPDWSMEPDKSETYANTTAIISQLLKGGADPNLADAEGDTPLFTAILLRCETAIPLLLSHGANVNAVRSRDGLTPLLLATGFDDGHGAKQLVSRGANVNAQDLTGGTALMNAAITHNSDLVSFLLTHGADITLRNKSGHSALDCARLSVKRGPNEKVISILERAEKKRRK